MKNALTTNLTTPVRNLGRWRPIDELKKDKTVVLVCGSQFGEGWTPEKPVGYALMQADICEHHNVKFWQPLDQPPSS